MKQSHGFSPRSCWCPTGSFFFFPTDHPFISQLLQVFWEQHIAASPLQNCSGWRQLPCAEKLRDYTPPLRHTQQWPLADDMGVKKPSPLFSWFSCVIYAPDTCGSGCSLPGSFSFALNLVSPKATPARNEMHPNLGLKLRFQETPPTSVSLLFIACFRDLQWEALVYIHPFRPVFLFRRREGQRKGENENLLQTPH